MLVSLYMLNFFVIVGIVRLSLYQFIEDNNLGEGSIRSCNMVLEHLIAFSSGKHMGWNFQAEGRWLVLDDGRSAR